LLGTAIAYASQQLYIAWSGNPSEHFGSSFSSDLLWYRLFPNVTYRLGILPSAILVSLPLLSLIFLRLRSRRWGYHPIRLLGLGGILSLLFTGGVVVSLKIGGGSNLHNLDAYLVLLLVIGTFVYFGALRDETNACDAPVQQYRPILAAAAALPVLLAVTSPIQMPLHDFETAEIEMDILRDEVHQASKHGEVLFISQRHLLAFNEDFRDISLVPDYEKVFLMEMVMANNSAYLDKFYQELQSQRYSLIITDPLNIQYQGRTHSFGEENDAWVSRAAEPILCYYRPVIDLLQSEIQLLVPRDEPCE